MVRIDIVRAGPIERLDGGIGFRTHVVGFAVNDGVLAVGFVPDGMHLQPERAAQNDRLQLGAALPGKTVTHSQSKLFDSHGDVGKLAGRFKLARVSGWAGACTGRLPSAMKAN